MKPLNKLSYHLILIQSSLRLLTDHIDQLNKIIEEDKTKALLIPVQNYKSAGNPIPETSIINSVYENIKRSRKGIAFMQIQKKTGFRRKQIANAVYKLKKGDMIIAKRRGVYVKR